MRSARWAALDAQWNAPIRFPCAASRHRTDKGVGDGTMEFLRDVWAFMRARRKYWLVPVIILLFLFSAVIVLTSGSAIAPFIYTVF